MKQLFWKEWRELRQLPLASAVCMVLIVFGQEVYVKLGSHTSPFALDNVVPLLWFISGVFSLVIGATVFSQDVGNGGLMFLSTLPVSRGRIWLIKTCVATTVLLLSLLLIGTALALPLFLTKPDIVRGISGQAGRALDIVPDNLLILLDIFAMSLAVSPLFDRPLSAVICAAFASGLSYAAIGAALNTYMLRHLSQYVPHLAANHVLIPALFDFDHLTLAVASLPLPVLLAVSYWTFTRGESLRSAKRFRVGAAAGIVSLATAGLVLGLGHWALLW